MLNHDRRGAGAPLVLLHGIGSRWQVWRPVLDALAAEHDVIAVDFPGFGGSPALRGRTDVAALTDATVALAAELGLEDWHVAGSSTGGGVALELARRGAVASATAVSPIGFWSTRERRFAQVTLSRSRSVARGLRAAGLLRPAVRTAAGRTILLEQLFGRPWRQTPADCVADVDAFLDCPAWDDVLSAFTGYVAPFDHGAVPTTVLWGDRDRLLLPRQARRARTAMPNAYHAPLPSCGHLPFGDDPDLVANALLAATRRGG